MASAWLKLILQNPQNEYREQNVDGKQKRKTVVTGVDLFQIGSPLRAPLLKFLVHYSTQTVDYFLLQLAGSQMNRLLMVRETLLF